MTDPEFLAQVPLFSRVKHRDLKRLAKRMTERSFKKGESITVEGDGGLGFFVIADGIVAVEVGEENVRVMHKGDYFGEVALIVHGSRSATVIAETDMRCHRMTSSEFQPFVMENPEVAWMLLETLAVRLRDAETRGAASHE